MEDIDSGYEFGKLAEDLLNKYQNKEVYAKVLEPFHCLIRPWREHLRETIIPLQKVYFHAPVG